MQLCRQVFCAALTQLPLEFSKAAEGGADEVAILVLDVFQDVLPVQADGIRDEERTVQVCQQPSTQKHHPAFTAKVTHRKTRLNLIYAHFCRSSSEKKTFNNDILLGFPG